ncbi:MAG: hypothetical protein OES38_08920, partial [Gammaproteobacteria bacterium]|nr:hypothetical protein [Gammaproteobacteria bacterium]
HSLSYRHVHKASGWFGEVGASLSDGDADAFSNGDLDGNRYRLAIGRYLTPATAALAFVAQDEQKTKSTFSSTCSGVLFCLGITSDSRTKTDVLSVGIAVRHVGQVRNHHYAVGGFVQHDESDTVFSAMTTVTENPQNLPITTLPPVEFKISISDIWRAGIDASWYFTQDLSIGAGYSFTESRGNQDHSYSLQGRWFITPRVELRLRVARTDLDLTDDEVDLVGVTVGGRI